MGGTSQRRELIQYREHGLSKSFIYAIQNHVSQSHKRKRNPNEQAPSHRQHKLHFMHLQCGAVRFCSTLLPTLHRWDGYNRIGVERYQHH
jgi:hypothetical protein